MRKPRRETVRAALVALAGTCLLAAGCQTCSVCDAPAPPLPFPKELKKVTHPPYVIEPPDILEIDAISVVPKPPYHISPLDVLIISNVADLIEGSPINGPFAVDPEGTVNLGGQYGTVSVAGLTLDEARAAIDQYLKVRFKPDLVKVAVSLGQSRGTQQIRGEHLVTPDGTISLGLYGEVNVTGLTVPQAKEAIERQLSQYLLRPEISLSITGYNSKVYYVIFDGGGYGQTMYRLPVTGNETVLDAIAQVNGLPAIASLQEIWIARPAPDDVGCEQILPVDWLSVTQKGAIATNYQIFPGDRIHVRADCLIASDNFLAKLYAPIERTFGLSLIGTQTVRGIKFFGVNNGGGGLGGGLGALGAFGGF